MALGILIKSSRHFLVKVDIKQCCRNNTIPLTEESGLSFLSFSGNDYAEKEERRFSGKEDYQVRKKFIFISALPRKDNVETLKNNNEMGRKIEGSAFITALLVLLCSANKMTIHYTYVLPAAL